MSGAAKTIYVGGQNAIGPEGVIGDDLATQAAAVLSNIDAVLKQAGGSLTDVVSWTIFVVEGQDVREGFGAFQQAWPKEKPSPAITVAFVSGLGNPAYLCEISAIAVLAA